jgi:hypothetical protein
LDSLKTNNVTILNAHAVYFSGNYIKILMDFLRFKAKLQNLYLLKSAPNVLWEFIKMEAVYIWFVLNAILNSAGIVWGI